MDRVDGLVVAAAALYLAGLTFWSGAGTAATLFPG